MTRHGYAASARAIEAPRGLAQTYSAKCDWSEITDELGQRFEISFNPYKPFACGIVIHPSIDGCVQLRDAHAPHDRIHATVDPAIDAAAADVTVTGIDGRTLHLFVPHALGSRQQPMTDDDLARKFHGLVDPVPGASRADFLIAQCMRSLGVRAVTIGGLLRGLAPAVRADGYGSDP